MFDLDIEWFASLDDALRTTAKYYPSQKQFIIGGEQIYKVALNEPLVDEVIMTKIKGKFSGDRFFPELLLLATLIALFIITQYLKSSSLKNNRNNEIHNQHNNLKIFKKSISKFTPSSRAYIQKQSTIDPDATNILSRFDKGRENNE